MPYGLGRGWAAVDIEFALVPAVRPQMRGENAAVAVITGLLLRLQDECAGAIAEQHAGRTIVPVEDAGEGLRPDHQGSLKRPGAQQRVRCRQSEDEARTHRLQIEGGATGDAEPTLH